MKTKNDVYALLAVKDIDMLAKIIEAYNHLGIVSTIDRDKGIVVIRCTPDTYPEIIEVIQHLPFYVQIIQSD